MKKEKPVEDYCKVALSHLRARVHFTDMSKLQGVPKIGSAYTMVMENQETDGSIDIYVFITDIEKTVKKLEWSPIICHEIIHVIQILCEHCQMQIHEEKEHTAYIASLLFERLLKLT